MKRVLAAAWARAYVRVVAANRELSWVVTEIAIPSLALIVYLLIYRNLNAPKDYEAMVLLGGAMIPFWLTMLWSMATQFYWEKEMGNLQFYVMSPVPFAALLLGMAAGGMYMASIRAAVIIAVGVLAFGVKFHISSVPMLAAAFALTISAIFMLGAAASSIYFVLGRMGIKLNMLLMEPVYALGGFFFPVKTLGRLGAALVSVFPVTLGLDAIRQLTLANAHKFMFLDYRIELAILFAMTLVFGAAAFLLIDRMLEKGRKLGTLAMRWQ